MSYTRHPWQAVYTVPQHTAATKVSAAEAPAASKWPGSTVQLYVPAAAGGGSDLIARVFAQAMSEKTGGNFVVVNDATGGGSVAAETVRNGKADGLNLYLGLRTLHPRRTPSANNQKGWYFSHFPSHP